ncbi:hypothetical protein LZ30DRAFT_721533 [Colletotrichum cereale]|nr:hypothetical protein LZ30DRAFT_721533 [Colletotrichum cereale]
MFMDVPGSNMAESRSTARLEACFFGPLTLDDDTVLKAYQHSIQIIGDTKDGCYTEIAVDSACIADLRTRLAFWMDLPYFVLPSWHILGLEEAVSQWLSEATSRVRNGGGRPLMKYYCRRARQTFSFTECTESMIPIAPLKWAALYYEVKTSSSTIRTTYVQILAFCGLLIDTDSPSLRNFDETALLNTLESKRTIVSNDDQRELHVIALLRCLFELAGGGVDRDEICDLDQNISFADNIQLCATLVNVNCSKNWTLRLARNIELCESVINPYSAAAALESETHQPLYFLAIAAAFDFSRSSFLQFNHTSVFKGVQELGILLPNNTLETIPRRLAMLLSPNDARKLSIFLTKVRQISLFTGAEELQDTWSFLIWRATCDFDRAEINEWAKSKDGQDVLNGLRQAVKSRRLASESVGISIAIASFYQLLPSARPESFGIESPKCDFKSLLGLLSETMEMA